MTISNQIISLWRKGYDTYAILLEISKTNKGPITEADIHKIITAERNERKARLGFKTIEGGRNVG